MLHVALAAVYALSLTAFAGTQDKPLPKVASSTTGADKAAGPMIGHMVYFKLKDATAENKKKLVDACKKYLADHDGVVFFSAGVLSDAFKRDVNDREWDVALHLVFTDKAAHDKYQDHAQHLKFIEENKDGWAKVRVFDSELADYSTGKKGK
jgi:hypothetical protein